MRVRGAWALGVVGVTLIAGWGYLATTRTDPVTAEALREILGHAMRSDVARDDPKLREDLAELGRLNDCFEWIENVSADVKAGRREWPPADQIPEVCRPEPKATQP